MVKKALFVGINYYRIPQNQLNGCVDDVVNMRNLLIDAYGYDLSNMILLRDDTNDPTILPTKKNILNALNVLVANSGNDTEFWFHYSGHGSKIQITKTQTDAVIVPCDYLTAGYILDNDLYAIFKNAKCRCFLLFDSCNSGNIVELPWTFQYQSNGQVIKTNVNNHTLANVEIYMISGCKDTQTSSDMYSTDLEDYVGAFTNMFITCMRQNKHEPTIMKLYTDICGYLALNKFVQVPTLSTTVTDPNYTFVRAGSNITVTAIKNIPKLLPTISSSVRLSKMLFY